MRVIAKAVQLIYEDRPLFRIIETSGDVVDVELNENQLLGLLTQASKIVRDYYVISKPQPRSSLQEGAAND